MAKTLTEAKINTREQRRKLSIGVHWRGIDPDVHLGYRKGKRGGTWLVRWYDGKKYQQRTFGTADDELREGTFDFGRAVKEARELVEAGRRTAQAAAAGPLLTVRHAVEAYMSARDARDAARKGRETRSDATSRLSRYVTGQVSRGKRKGVLAAPLSEVPLHTLTEADLLEWRAGLPETLKGTTKRRLVNDLKAALNATYADSRSRLPSSLPTTIKHGLRSLDEADHNEPIARENQILSAAQVASVVRAAQEVDAEQGWDGDLFRLILILAATGARFSQVVRMRVRDLQPDAKRLIIPVSLKGKRGKTGSTPFPLGRDVLDAMAGATSGRSKDAPLLERWRSKQVAGSIRWERIGRGAWRTASELNRPWAAIRERADLPKDVVVYSLRHSSIVRFLSDNQPIRLVAALHDTSVAMIERHYGRFIADGLEEMAARSVVPLVRLSEDQKVVALPRR